MENMFQQKFSKCVESDYYVRLKGSKENYEKLEEAYQKRVKELNEQSKEDSEMEIS